jgi:hypothetical protein
MATKSISQMIVESQADGGDFFEVVVPDPNSQTGYASKRISLAVIAEFIAETAQNSGLGTTDKTLVGAINEVMAAIKKTIYSAYGATAFTSNTDLNSAQYTAAGKYYGGTSVISTLANCPASVGFMMEVYNATGTNMQGMDSAGSQYRIRRITDVNNNIFQQVCYTTSGGAENYGSWKKVTMTNP